MHTLEDNVSKLHPIRVHHSATALTIHLLPSSPFEISYSYSSYLLFSSLYTTHRPSAPRGKGKVDAMDREVRTVCLYFVGLACIAFFCGYLQISNFSALSMRLTNRIRLLYLRAALRQDISFYDTDTGGSGILNSINEDTSHIQSALADKAAIFIQGVSAFTTGFVVAYWRAWEIALIGSGAFPMMAIAATLFGMATTKVAVKAQAAYNKANSSSQEAIMSAYIYSSVFLNPEPS